MKKTKILFVGSFLSKSKTGHVGGQMFACTSLVNSRISEEVEWHLIDTTATTNKKRSFAQRAYRAFLRLAKFVWALLTQRIDIVLLFVASGYSFREKGLMVQIAKFFGKKTILAPCSGLIKNDVEESESMRKFVSKIINKTDRVICQGPSWKKYYIDLSGSTDTDKFVVVHNWMDMTPYLREDSNNEKESSPVRIVYLGWLDKNKGILDLLHAIKLLKDANVSNFVVDVAGNGDLFDEALAYSKDAGLSEIVDFKSWVMGDAKIELLHNSDIYVMCSYREGYPNSLLEAMLCGLPPVATTVGAIPDIIEDGKNGYLFTSGDAPMLKEKLHALIESKEKRISFGKNAKATILKNNTLDQAVTIFGEVFDNLKKQ